MLILTSVPGLAQVDPPALPADSIEVGTDTLQVGLDSLQAAAGRDSLATFGVGFGNDSTQKDSLSPAQAARQAYVDSLKTNSDLKAKVEYNAEDSIVFDVENNQLILYEKAQLKYTEIDLKAKVVSVDIKGQTLNARGEEDGQGNYDGMPEFSQGDQPYKARTIAYNFETEKGLAKRGRAVQGEGYVLADLAKYQPDGSFHGKSGKYTTCDADDPHFYIQSRKLKVLPDGRLISGPLNLVIGDFPIPIILPFGFVPNTQQGQQDGVILPQYGEADDRGFFLRNIGYYIGINDYFDLRLDGDIFTRGGWRIGGTLNYRKRYSFNGSFRLQYGVQTFNERTDPDYRRTAAWNLTWNHSQPIDPTARISASVNISSSSSFQRQISLNQSDFFTNNLNSSVSFQKNFNNLPFSLGISARHQQDLNKGTMSMQLPEMNLNMNRQTPFKGVSGRNFNWLRQLGLNYSMQARNSIANFPDSLFLPLLFNPKDSVLIPEVNGGDTTFILRPGTDFYSNGMRHNSSLGTTLKLFQYINLSPSLNYSEYWYTQSTRKVWNPETQRIEDEPVPGFTRGFEYNASVGASTNFYGIYQLTKSKRQIAFRQRFTPTVSYSLRPDFADPSFGFYREVQRDTLGNTEAYSIFEDGIYRGPSQGESQSIGFSLNSVIEMKYRKKESFEDDFPEKEDKFQRANLIDNLSLSGSYNLAADSFQLSTFNLAARTSLFNNKVNLNTSAALDPYVFDKEAGTNGRRVDRYLFQETGQLGRLTRAQISLSTSFRSKQKTGGRQKSEDFDEAEFRQIQNTAYQYVDFTVPWSLNLRYNLSYSNPGAGDPRITSTANLSGDLNFTEKWKMGFQSGFDVVNQEVTQTSLTIFRDLHCWEMSFRWVPFGPLRSYTFTLNVRSSTLRDLRITKNNFWQDRFQ